jgi:hypothetical protein
MLYADLNKTFRTRCIYTYQKVWNIVKILKVKKNKIKIVRYFINEQPKWENDEMLLPCSKLNAN